MLHWKEKMRNLRHATVLQASIIIKLGNILYMCELEPMGFL